MTLDDPHTDAQRSLLPSTMRPMAGETAVARLGGDQVGTVLPEGSAASAWP